MAHKVTLIPGDGIGPEVTGAAIRIIENTGVKIDWETINAGSQAFEKYNEYIPKELIGSIERTGVAIKGPITTPIGGGFASINVTLRKKFDLYANYRPIKNLPGLVIQVAKPVCLNPIDDDCEQQMPWQVIERRSLKYALPS